MAFLKHINQTMALPCLIHSYDFLSVEYTQAFYQGLQGHGAGPLSPIFTYSPLARLAPGPLYMLFLPPGMANPQILTLLPHLASWLPGSQEGPVFI